MKPTYIWMAVTADQYELPLAVADTAPELAKILGISKRAVWQGEHQACVGIIRNPGKICGYKIIKLSIDSEEDDEYG